MVCSFLCPSVLAKSDYGFNLASIQSELGIDVSKYAIIGIENQMLTRAVTACPYGNGICNAVS